jgi:hypothetical protein
MAAKPTNLGTRIYWWAILILRLMFTHPAKWEWVKAQWRRDREPKSWD